MHHHHQPLTTITNPLDPSPRPFIPQPTNKLSSSKIFFLPTTPPGLGCSSIPPASQGPPFPIGTPLLRCSDNPRAYVHENPSSGTVSDGRSLVSVSVSGSRWCAQTARAIRTRVCVRCERENGVMGFMYAVREMGMGWHWRHTHARGARWRVFAVLSDPRSGQLLLGGVGCEGRLVWGLSVHRSNGVESFVV